MQRLLTLFLLICFGVIAPVQSVPFRLCLQENAPQAASTDSKGYQKECCGTCGNAQWGQHRSECCVDVDQQSQSTVPRLIEQQLSFELPVSILLTSQWMALFRPVIVTELGYPPVRDVLIPVSGSERQAVLSIWTV